MSFCCADRAPLVLAAALALLAVPAVAAAEPLPVDDNELIVGGGVGPWFVEQIDDENRADVTLRIGVAAEIFVGLMRRMTPWLDLEVAAGAAAYWLGNDGLEQRAPTGTVTRSFLPGAVLRGGARFLTADDGLGLTALVGFAAAFYAAPAAGAFAQVSAELGAGLDILRDAETHLGVELVYGLHIADDLPDEPGVALLDPTHRLVVRVSYGF